MSGYRGSKREFQGKEDKGMYSCGFVCMWWDVKRQEKMELEPLRGEKWKIILASKGGDSSRRALKALERTV